MIANINKGNLIETRHGKEMLIILKIKETDQTKVSADVFNIKKNKIEDWAYFAIPSNYKKIV